MGADDARRYVIHGGARGVDRLRILGRVVAPTTRALLERAGVGPGMACLDVGCGGGDSTAELARLVAPDGRVVAIDADAAAVDLARRTAAARGLAHVEFRVGLAGEGATAPEFDVGYARFLLTHLRDPAAAVAWMRAHLRPGGVLVLEDIDFRGHFCHPANAAFDRYTALYAAVVQSAGADPFIGPRLPDLLRAAGCEAVAMQVVQPAGFDPDVKVMAAITTEGIAARAAAAGLATRAELASLAEALHAFARDPHSVMSLPRIVQAWGRAPDG
ncbi:methyltransferase domain-containing protein [bacterium]|nr:methyltransferase domain-containing protein [bacterium]